MRRLTEILAFPKAWYRRSIARRMFLGDQSTGALYSDQGILNILLSLNICSCIVKKKKKKIMCFVNLNFMTFCTCCLSVNFTMHSYIIYRCIDLYTNFQMFTVNFIHFNYSFVLCTYISHQCSSNASHMY